LGFIFQRIKPWTGQARSVHRGPTTARTEGGWGGARRRAHRSSDSDRSGAPKLTGGGATERGAHGELDEGLTGARAASRRMGDGGEGSAASVLSDRVAQAWREGKRSGVRCDETRWRCSPFIGGRGSAGEGWPASLTPALMALMPLKIWEGLRGDIREGK
jgi:hypothetical protein